MKDYFHYKKNNKIVIFQKMLKMEPYYKNKVINIYSICSYKNSKNITKQ